MLRFIIIITMSCFYLFLYISNVQSILINGKKLNFYFQISEEAVSNNKYYMCLFIQPDKHERGNNLNPEVNTHVRMYCKPYIRRRGVPYFLPKVWEHYSAVHYFDT